MASTATVRPADGLSASQTIHCGVQITKTARASQFQRCQTSTAAAAAAATSRNAIEPRSSSDPTSTGANRQPTMPSAATTRASQRTAIAVASAPTTKASTRPNATGIRWYTCEATVTVAYSAAIDVATAARAASVRPLRSWSQIPAHRRASEPAPARSVRVTGPIQPCETASAKKSTTPTSSAIPPTQASTRPPRRSSTPGRSGDGFSARATGMGAGRGGTVRGAAAAGAGRRAAGLCARRSALTSPARSARRISSSSTLTRSDSHSVRRSTSANLSASPIASSCLVDQRLTRP